MKFHVGDKVKVRKDLKVGEDYGNDTFVFGMAEFKGKTVTISKCNEEKYKIKEGDYNWTDEMLEKVEYTYEDLCNAPVGTKITFKSGEILFKVTKNNGNSVFRSDVWRNLEYQRTNFDLKNLEDNWANLGQIIKIEKPTYTTVYEAKKEILDEAEKRYLSNVIRPFRNEVKYISKNKEYENKQYISIEIIENIPIQLPYFERNTMYEGMEVNKKYSLEELGL